MTEKMAKLGTWEKISTPPDCRPLRCQSTMNMGAAKN